MEIPMCEGDLRSFAICPSCGIDLTESFLIMLSKVTGISVEELRNGAINEIVFKLRIAEITLMKARISIEEDEITEKTLVKVTSLLSEWERKMLLPKLTQDEREEYEQQIEECRRQFEDEREKRRELDQRFKEAWNRVRELEDKLGQVPYFKGEEQEKSLIKQLEAVARHIDDEFTLKNETSLGEDIICKVIDNGQIVGCIIIESKNVKKWKNEYIEQLKTEIRRQDAVDGILVTMAMPANALHKHFHVTKEGLWVVSPEATAIAYRAKRDFHVSLRRAQLSEKQATEALRLFQERVFSKGYLGKFEDIMEAANNVEAAANTIQSSVERRCTTLRKQAEAIRNRIEELKKVHDEIIEQVKGYVSSASQRDGYKEK